MTIKYLDLALDDVAGIIDWIAEDSPVAADRIARRIRADIDRLADQPGMGRPGRVGGTRELVINKGRHVAAYRVRSQVIEIIAVLDARREWPESFDDRIE